MCIYEGVSNKEAFKQCFAGQVKNDFLTRCATKKKSPKISVRLYLSGHFNEVTNQFNHMVRSWNLSGRDLGQAV